MPYASQKILRDFTFIMVDSGYIELGDGSLCTYGLCAYTGYGAFLFIGAGKSEIRSPEEGELVFICEGLKGATFVFSDSINCVNAIKGLHTVLH